MSTTGWPFYATLMFATGIGIPVMAALNARLGVRLESPPAAAAILFAVALCIALMATALTGGAARSIVGAAPLPNYLGGLAVAFYVLAITWVAPRFGLGNAVFFVLLGQISAAALIDHFGWFGVARSELGPTRLAGILLMTLGVYFARKPL